MAKDYSNAKAEEQMQKGEISPSELLKQIIIHIDKNY